MLLFTVVGDLYLLVLVFSKHEYRREADISVTCWADPLFVQI